MIPEISANPEGNWERIKQIKMEIATIYQNQSP
jgi:hypothetical protein